MVSPFFGWHSNWKGNKIPVTKAIGRLNESPVLLVRRRDFLWEARARLYAPETGDYVNDETMQVMRADGQDQDEPTHKFLFTVDEDGNMHVAILWSAG